MKKRTCLIRPASEVAGFEALYELMKGQMSLSGKSGSTLKNYAHHVAQMALHSAFSYWALRAARRLRCWVLLFFLFFKYQRIYIILNGNGFFTVNGFYQFFRLVLV
ncbi:MAG: hypothetical protein R3D00_05325 [Bacteroidia bacterium]